MKTKTNIQSMAKMALLLALVSVSAYIIIPLPFTPANLTAQTLVVNLVALLLTPREAALTMLAYTLLGLVGLPIFSGGLGGPAKLFGPTGGYIFSWIPAVFVMSWLKGEKYHFFRYSLVTIFAGMPLIYLIGTAYMKWTTGMSWQATLAAAVLPFIPLDVFKCVAAAFIAKPIQISLSNLSYTR